MPWRPFPQLSLCNIIALTIVTAVGAQADEPPFVAVAVGRPTYREPYRTQEVIANRVEWGDVSRAMVDDPHVLGYASVMDCSLIGRWVGIAWPDGYLYPYLVIDCVAAQDRDYNRATGFAVEVDKVDWLEQFSWQEYMGGVTVTVRTLDLQERLGSGIMPE